MHQQKVLQVCLWAGSSCVKQGLMHRIGTALTDAEKVKLASTDSGVIQIDLTSPS
jgi:hypothetical protein